MLLAELSGYKKFQEILRAGLEADFIGNLAKRGSTIVILDPVFDYSSEITLAGIIRNHSENNKTGIETGIEISGKRKQ